MSDFQTKIKKSLLSGAIWQALQTGVQDLVIFLLGVVLARLLTPEDFGIYAIILFFVSVFEVFSEGGMGVALVRKQHIDRFDCSAVLLYNVGIGLVCVGVLWIAAPWIGAFYKMPESVWLLRILSLKILIDAVRTVSFARLRRELQFKKLAMLRISATAAGGASGLGMALAGCGVWSFVGQQLISAIVMTGLCLLWMPWKMTLQSKMQNFKELFSFGGGLLAINVLNRAMNNLYTLIIGKAYSADALGFYNRAQALQGIPVRLGQTIIGEAGGTVLYRLQGDDRILQQYLFQLLQMTGFLFFPILFALAASAEPAVVFLLGEKWIASAQYLPILCCMGIFLEINYFANMLYKVKGKVRVLFWSETAVRGSMLLFAVICFCIKGDILWLLWSGVAAYGIGYLYDCLMCGKMLDFGFMKRISLLWKILLCNGLMYFVLQMTWQYLLRDMPAFFALMILFAEGVTIYWLTSHLLNAPGYREGINFLKQRLS